MNMDEYSVLHLPEIDSTNAYAARNFHQLPDRQVISADLQTRGKGRLGRRWFSGSPGNVYASIVLKPRIAGEAEFPLANISQYLALCICETFDAYKVAATLKWPNDIMVMDRKIAGILGQSFFRGSSLEGLVIGAGINLNLSPEDLLKTGQPAASLNRLTGSRVDRDRFLKILLNHFFEGYGDFIFRGFGSIRDSYSERCSFLGREISVRLPENDISGKALRIGGDGCLVIMDSHKKMETRLNAGDVVSSSDSRD